MSSIGLAFIFGIFTGCFLMYCVFKDDIANNKINLFDQKVYKCTEIKIGD